jgi:hypothetical protein
MTTTNQPSIRRRATCVYKCITNYKKRLTVVTGMTFNAAEWACMKRSYATIARITVTERTAKRSMTVMIMHENFDVELITSFIVSIIANFIEINSTQPMGYMLIN